MPVSKLQNITIDSLVDMALSEAPVATEKVASVLAEGNQYLKVSESLQKLAGELEANELASLTDYKANQTEKVAQMREIIETYVELAN